jgi:predicted HD phosphohydrolase
VSYTRMDRSTAEDWVSPEADMAPATLDLVLGQLELLKEADGGGAAVNRYTHSLQTASRALHDGEDDETVVCALLHDIGDSLAPANHAELAAAVLRPFVGDQNWWVVKHHDIFQGYYYFHFVGEDRLLRDAYRGHPYFKACVRFCERWDQRSFDPDYPTESLNRFLPMTREIFGRAPKDTLIVAGPAAR